MPDVSVKEKESLLKETMKTLAPEFNPVEEMRSVFSHHFIEAAYFNRKFLSDRRAMGVFVGIDVLRNPEPVVEKLLTESENPDSNQWADIIILYMVTHNPADVEEAKALVKAEIFNDPRLLVAIPRQIAGIAGGLLLFKTLSVLAEKEESPAEKADWQNKLEARKPELDKLMLWENWNWYYQGNILEKNDDISEDGVISIFMEKIYSDSINPGMKCLGNHQHLNEEDQLLIKSSVEAILNLDSPLVFTKERYDKSSIILRQLGELGLLKRISKPGWEEKWTEISQLPDDSPVKPLWKELTMILKAIQTGEDVSFMEIYELFKYPEFGTTTAFMELVFSVFYRCFHHQLVIYKGSDDAREEMDKLTFENLNEMLEDPEAWKIGLRKELPEEKVYLESVKAIFPVESETEEKYNSLWEETKHIIVSWYDHLPGVVLKESFESPKAMAFLKALAQHKNDDSREILLVYIPESLGFSAAKPDMEGDTGKVSEMLAEIVEEINEKTDLLRHKLWKEITRLLYLPSEEDKVDKVLEDWLEQINSEKYSPTYRGDCKILFDLIKSEGEKSTKVKLVEDLPVKMGIGPIKDWEMNRLPELSARLDKAIYHMSVMQFLEMKEVDDPDKKKEFISKWFSKIVKNMEFEPDELERFLEKYLEDIA